MVSELNNQNINVQESKQNCKKICKKNYLIQDNVYGRTYILGLYYRVASLETLYFVVPGISIPKIRSNG